MLEMGIVVGIGLLVVYARLSMAKRIWINSHPLFMDIAVFVLLNMLHWGSFAGTMVAAVGALFCSLAIGVTRRWHGYYDKSGCYIRGWVDVSSELR